MRRLLAEWNDAFLAALALHPHELLLEVDVGEIDVDRLLRAKPRGVHELDQRAVSDRERPLPGEPLQRSLDLVDPRCVGKSTRPSRAKRGVRHTGRPERVAK